MRLEPLPAFLRDPELELLMGDLNGAQKKRAELESQMLEMRTNFAVIKQQMDDPAMVDMQVSQILMSDPQYSSLQQEVMMAQSVALLAQRTSA